MSITEQRSATFRCAAAWRGRPLAFALLALICVITIAGCSPPTLTVVGSGVDFEGGCGVHVQAANLQPHTTYELGMYATHAPVVLGDVTTDAAGSVHGSNGWVNYPSHSPPSTYRDLTAAVYTLSGALLATASTGNVQVCWPAGLHP